MSTATHEPKTRSAGAVRTDRLCPNTWNKARPLDEAFTASIKARGILSPLLVREMGEPDFKGRDLEIICGERRWRAAMEAGLEYVPAVIQNSTDEDAQTDTLIENTHRVGLSPWQEAQLVGELLEKPGMDVSAVSAATGWSEAMIRRRAKLLELSPSWRKAIEEDSLPAWTIAHYEILAIFDEKRQEELFKEIKYRAAGLTLAELKEEIATSSESLKSVPWDLDDVTLLPKVGACTACPKRSDAQADLFGQVPEMVKAGASCLDESCFKKKLAAHSKRKEDAILEKHPDAIKVTDGFYSAPKGALRNGEWKPAKKGDKGAVPAIKVGERGQVTQTYVKVGKPKSQKDSKKEAEAKRRQRIDARALELLADYITSPDLEFTEVAREVLIQYLLIRGTKIEIDGDEEARVRAFAKKPLITEELWKSAVERMEGDLRSAKWNLDEEPAANMPAVQLVAWLVDADFTELRRRAETEIDQKPSEDAAAQALADGSAADELDGPDEDMDDE